MASRPFPAARQATHADLNPIVETITLAFADDPVWRPTLTRPGAGPQDMHSFWSIWVRGALRHSWVWLLDEAAAVSVWIPPGADELSAEQETEMTELARSTLGEEGLALLNVVFERFEAAHPQAQPHFYLSLLGTHPRWRGLGLGIGLLRANLQLQAQDDMAAYLESSNPANDARYMRVGFKPIVRFELPAGQRVAGMWRRPGSPEASSERGEARAAGSRSVERKGT
jgi:GNAT superfamily N-acetyltransferase